MTNNTGANTRLAVAITVLIITATLILDRLVPEGIFLDGVTYAAISRNLALGKGTFWSLRYWSDVPFSEHPPLMFGMQALFFKLFGDHYYTEKIYCLVIWSISALLIRSTWNTGNSKQSEYSYALPLLMWCLIPTVTWGYTNNILDCTMAMFDMAAVLVMYKSLKANGKLHIPAIIISALFTVCAMLTKGPVGIFPLAVPGLWWLTNLKSTTARLARTVMETILLAAFISGCFLIIYQFPPAKISLDKYMNQQLLAALQGKREITGGGLGRLSLLVEIFVQMLLPLAVAVVVLIIGKITKVNPDKIKIKKTALFFLLVGIAASLPMMSSVKQRTFYLIPSLPFYVLALATLALPYYHAITNKMAIGNGIRYFKMASIIACIGLSIYLGSKFGQVGRNHELIETMKYMNTQLPTDQEVSICDESRKDYELLAYLQRYNNINIQPIFYAADYILIDKNVCNTEGLQSMIKTGFKKQPFELSRYELYKRNFPLRFDFTLLHPAFRTGDR